MTSKRGVFFALYNKKEINKYLKEHLNPKRYAHSIGVMETAVKMADIYGADKNKAEIAGLVHDCAKNMSSEELINYANMYNIRVDNILKTSPSLLHGPVGAYVAKELFNIDQDIFDSIYYHTTGKADMSILTKIIYLADYIEPTRTFPGVEKLRKISFENLNDGLILAFNNTINFVIQKNGLIHCNTIEARNYLIIDKGAR